MRLPLFIRRLICTYKMLTNPEYGGLLANWNRGKYDVLHRWDSDKGLEQAWEIVENNYHAGRDEIYIALIRQGVNRGYFCLHGPEIMHFPYAFWDNWITTEEAMIEIRNRCIVLAKKMGYAVEESNEQTTDN